MARVEHGSNMAVRDRPTRRDVRAHDGEASPGDRERLAACRVARARAASRREAARRGRGCSSRSGCDIAVSETVAAAAGAVLGERGLELASRLLDAARGLSISIAPWRVRSTRPAAGWRLSADQALEPEVTVVIPTRDRWPLLSRHALPSALAQQDVELEVLVVDDGSRDDTVERGWRRSRTRVSGSSRPRVTRSGGWRATRASPPPGASGSRSSTTTTCGRRGKLRAQLDAIGPAGWGYTGAFVVDAALRAIHVLPLAAPSGSPRRSATGTSSAAADQRSSPAATVLRRAGRVRPALFYVEDWDLWLRLAEHCPAVACEDLLVATLDHPQRALFRDRRRVARGIERCSPARAARATTARPRRSGLRTSTCAVGGG